MLTGDDRVNCIEWVIDNYDYLEDACNDVSIDVISAIDAFKNTLLSECVDVLDRMPAYEKFKCGCQEFMTADELSPCLARWPPRS